MDKATLEYDSLYTIQPVSSVSMRSSDHCTNHDGNDKLVLMPTHGVNQRVGGSPVLKVRTSAHPTNSRTSTDASTMLTKWAKISIGNLTNQKKGTLPRKSGKKENLVESNLGTFQVGIGHMMDVHWYTCTEYQRATATSTTSTGAHTKRSRDEKQCTSGTVDSGVCVNTVLPTTSTASSTAYTKKSRNVSYQTGDEKSKPLVDAADTVYIHNTAAGCGGSSNSVVPKATADVNLNVTVNGANDVNGHKNVRKKSGKYGGKARTSSRQSVAMEITMKALVTRFAKAQTCLLQLEQGLNNQYDALSYLQHSIYRLLWGT